MPDEQPAPGAAEVGTPESQDRGAVPALSVAGAARGLGVAAATLRSWERRYGLAPSLHTPGGHRRYGPEDLARLAVMHRLVRDGVPPAEAARVAIRSHARPGDPQAGAPFAAVLDAAQPDGGAEQIGPPDDAAHRPAGQEAASSVGAPPGGGRVLAMPRRAPSARGLARSAMALDAASCRRSLAAALADRGTVATWEELVRPVLGAIGERWEATGSGVEIEHSFSVVVAGALAGHAARQSRARNDRPVLLACAPDELHDLPLLALQAALSEVGIRAQVLGARTPVAALDDAVTRIGPPVVFLWAQMPTAMRPQLPALRPVPALVLGGPGWGDGSGVGGRPADLAGAVAAVSAAMGL